MSRVKSKDTTPEMAVRRMAHSLGYRYRLHRSDLPGKPDLVFPRFKKIIFVHGCFWHRHEGCPKATFPKSRTEYWAEKFRNNTKRDRRNINKLVSLGWTVMVIWQCQTKDPNQLERLLKRFLDDKRQ